jgi:DNA-binding CsgD family transcriptional regulator
MAEIHRWLAGARTHGVRAGQRHAAAALHLADQLDDNELRAGALAEVGFLRFQAGEPGGLELTGLAHDLAATTQNAQLRFETGVCHVSLLSWSTALDEARRLADELYQEFGAQDERAGAQALWELSLIELRAGRLKLAADHAARQRAISLQYTIDDHEDPLAMWPVALIAAHRGDLEGARRLAQRSRALAEGQPHIAAGQEGVLGLVECWSGNAAHAAVHLAAADRYRISAEVVEPNMYWWRADYIETLLKLDRTGEALDLLDRWEADATRVGRGWVLAQTTRCRGLVAASCGDQVEAIALLERAVTQHEACRDPLGSARTLLSLGILRRRALQKRSSREAIEAALERFESAGADGWAHTARGELGKIGGRKHQTELTAAESRVADLVAKGHTNREVATELFLSQRTVASHLTHIYTKLGLRSRTELARRLD